MADQSGGPPVVQQITFLYAEDFQRSARFYRETMGFKMVLDQGGCRIYQVSGSGYLGVCRRGESQEPEVKRGVIFTLVTPAVDDWYIYLVDKGVEVEGKPQHNQEYGIYHFFLRDPAGYRLEIQRFLDQGWAAE